jgi:hypothetical protein
MPDPYTEGFRAFRQGLNNPYDRGTDEYWAWHDGNTAIRMQRMSGLKNRNTIL